MASFDTLTAAAIKRNTGVDPNNIERIEAPYRDEYLEVYGLDKYSQRERWYEVQGWQEDLRSSRAAIEQGNEAVMSRATATAGARGIKKGTAAWDTLINEAKSIYAADFVSQEKEENYLKKSGLYKSLYATRSEPISTQGGKPPEYLDSNKQDMYQGYNDSLFSGGFDQVQATNSDGSLKFDTVQSWSNPADTGGESYLDTKVVPVYNQVKVDSQGSLEDYFTKLYGTEENPSKVKYSEYFNPVQVTIEPDLA